MLKSAKGAILIMAFLQGLIPLHLQKERNSTALRPDDFLDQLIAAQTRSPAELAKLLEERKNLISRGLWMRAIFEADRASEAHDFHRAQLTLEIATELANHLSDRKLLAQALNRTAAAYSESGYFQRAADLYLRGVQVCRETNSPMELLDTI